jgi:aspartate aminotransferase-like enzyme
MDALGANVVLGASQKGLMVPPGLAFVAADAAAMKVAAANPFTALLLGLGAAAKPAELPQVLRHAAAKPALWPGGGAGTDLS